jgi:hypothetical protein
MAKQTPEGRVKDAIKKEVVNSWPGTFLYMPVSNGMGSNGIPDFVCCTPITVTPEMVGMKLGVFVGIEAKTYKGKVSDLQRDKLEKILDAGGAACVVWGSDDVPNKIPTIMHTIGNELDEVKPK